MITDRTIPTVGRVVHYVAFGTPGGEFPAGVCRAAIITQIEQKDPKEVEEGTGWFVGLFIANPTGCFFNPRVAYNENHQPGTWHWVERV